MNVVPSAPVTFEYICVSRVSNCTIENCTIKLTVNWARPPFFNDNCRSSSSRFKFRGFWRAFSRGKQLILCRLGSDGLTNENFWVEHSTVSITWMLVIYRAIWMPQSSRSNREEISSKFKTPSLPRSSQTKRENANDSHRLSPVAEFLYHSKQPFHEVD